MRREAGCCPPRCLDRAASLTRLFAQSRYQFVLDGFARPLLSTSSLSRKRSGVRIASGLHEAVAIESSRDALSVQGASLL